VALAGGALVLVLAAWFDTTVVRDAMLRANAGFDPSQAEVVFAIGSLLVAGSVLLVGVLAWRAASLAAGLAYAVVGGFFLVLPLVVWNLATEVNGGPPVLPEPLLTTVSEIYFRTVGSLHAVGTIGGAMLIAGVVSLVRSQRDRAGSRSSIEALSPPADPSFP
jgi:hypothetical protein